MEKTVLCYIINGDYVLMLHKNKIKDSNYNKYLGVGGHIEKNETSDDALVREVKEETNLDLLKYKHRGTILFVNDNYEEEMYLYLGLEYKGNIKDSNEGTLSWVKKEDIQKLNIWEGDMAFLPKLFNSNEMINIKLIYENDKLKEVKEYDLSNVH